MCAPNQSAEFRPGHPPIASNTGTSYNFIGSQTSTGPALVNNWTANPYWNGSRYQQDPSKGALPTGYFEICIPVKPKPGKAGGGGGGGGGLGGAGYSRGYPVWWYQMWGFLGWVNSIPVGYNEVVTVRMLVE